jgi:peptidoglycan hydrolase-like protein with peptidoglycan-binding domain
MRARILGRFSFVATAAALLSLSASYGQAADFGFYGRSGDAIEINLSGIPGISAGSTFSGLALNATGHSVLGSDLLVGQPFASTGRFWVLPDPAGPGDVNGSARGYQGTLTGSLLVDGQSKTFSVTVQPGYTGSGPGSVGQSLEAQGKATNNKLFVAQQQQRLRYLGFVAQGGAPLVVDGDFGPATNTALRTFQAANIGGANTTQAGADGVIGPTTAGWLNAANATTWGQVASNADVTISNQINERHTTNWTADLIYKGSALAKSRGLGNQQTNALSAADGYGSSAYHNTHRVGTDIDLYTGVYGFGNGSLSTLEQKVANQAVAFIDTVAAGRVLNIITSNSDVRNNILSQRPGASITLDSTDVHTNHLHIDVGPPTFSAGRSNLAGDFNLDDTVNMADLAVWQQNFGTVYTGSDFLLWQRRYGASQTPLGAEATVLSVPEPQAILLAAWMGVLWRRRQFAAGERGR